MRRHRGIYLLPNLFTTAGILAGFYGMISALENRFETAAAAIFIAVILDGLDGRIARLTDTQTDFGTQYDSLSDIVSFGVAPALIIYQWSLFGLGKLGWLVAFFYTAATALRLARFNAQVVNNLDKAFFQGLPSPAAAVLVCGVVWCGAHYGIQYNNLMFGLSCLLPLLAGLLMVSNIRYNSFKQFDIKNRVPFVSVFFTLLVFVLIASEPPLILFSLALLYALSGPVVTVFLIRHWRAKNRKTHFIIK